jgi:hypothetical protein
MGTTGTVTRSEIRDKMTNLSLDKILVWMKENGSSVTLNWGEDTGAWEISWITGGTRYTGCATDIRQAFIKCAEIFLERFIEEV